MSRRASWLLAVSVAGLSAVALVGTFVVDTAWSRTVQAFGGLIFALTGGFIGVRARSNPVGWLLAISGVLLSLVAFLEAHGMAGLAFAEWSGWLASLLFLPALVALVILVPLLFPDGSLPNRRWKWVIWSTLTGMLFFWGGNGFNSELLDDYGLTNPLQVDLPVPLITFFQGAGVLLLAVGIVTGVTAAVSRFRSSRGVLRQQMKWFSAAAVLLVPAVAFNGWAYESGRGNLGIPIFILLVSALPVSIGMAVLRYQLYEIDRIISRTVSYAMVVGLLGLIVVTVAAVAGAQFETPWVVAATTLGVAALFNPLRKRIKVLVDRRFNRSRYDAERVMNEFAGSLQDQVDADGVVDGWVGVVSEMMQPEAVSVWVRR